jgi:hypothetical protein
MSAPLSHVAIADQIGALSRAVAHGLTCAQRFNGGIVQALVDGIEDDDRHDPTDPHALDEQINARLAALFDDRPADEWPAGFDVEEIWALKLDALADILATVDIERLHRLTGDALARELEATWARDPRAFVRAGRRWLEWLRATEASE